MDRAARRCGETRAGLSGLVLRKSFAATCVSCRSSRRNRIYTASTLLATLQRSDPTQLVASTTRPSTLRGGSTWAVLQHLAVGLPASCELPFHLGAAHPRAGVHRVLEGAGAALSVDFPRMSVASWDRFGRGRTTW